MSVLIREVPLRESGHYVGLCQPRSQMLSIYLCFPKMDRDNPNTFLDFLVLHHCFWVNKCLGAILCLHKIHMLVVQFPVFAPKCLHSVSFLQNYLQPKEHWQIQRLNFFICTFLFLYLCNSNWAHFFYLDDLTSIRRRLEGNWDPDQLWKTGCQVNCLVIQWSMQPASSEAPGSTMTSLTSELCGLVLGEVPWRRPSVRGGGGGSEALRLTWMRPAGNEDKAVNDPFVPRWNELLENVLVTKTVVWSEWAWWSQEFLKTFI